MSFRQTRIKYICRLAYGEALPNRECISGDIPVFGSNGEYSVHEVANTGAPVIVIGRKGSYGKINWSDNEVFASDTTFFVDSQTTSYSLRWLFWALQTLKLDEGSNEAAVPGLNRETVYESSTLLPDSSSQVLIANYLDRETAEIDELIREKEGMLTLLEEKRCALISHLVTRGVNAKVTLKDSGLDWLPQVPKSWLIRRCATLFTDRDERGDPSLPLLVVSLNTGVTLRSFESDRIEAVAEDFNSYKIAKKNDLVFNKMRFWQGAVGIAPEDGLTSPDYTVASISPLLAPEYVELLFRISIFNAEVKRYSHGMVDDRLRLYWDEFKAIQIPVPPFEEQLAIVKEIQRERERSFVLESALRDSITLLKERRAALITAAVTGQIPLNQMKS